MEYPVLLDIHTHSIASGHATADTITDMAKAASLKNISILGISDHAPASPGSAGVSYFMGLGSSFKKRFGVSMLYGAELNILNENGAVDLPDDVTVALDYSIVSMHRPTFKSIDRDCNTNAYINSFKHPRVRFIGHPDDDNFPVDYERLLYAAKESNVYPEINNCSLAPDSYRKNSQKNSRTILSLCKELDLPVLLSSDSHGKDNIANMHYAIMLLKECNFPTSLVINCNPDMLFKILSSDQR